MDDGLAPVHDLVRMRDFRTPTKNAPAWVERSLQRAPWAVVRRGYVRAGMIPVGIRGRTRSERFATQLSVAELAERRSPEHLFDFSVHDRKERKEFAPPLAALDRVTSVMESCHLQGGPGGSVGFEIATGAATVTELSDLDLIVRLERRLDRSEAIELLAVLSAAASPVRIDVLIETPVGGVLLADFASASERVLVRTPDGPRLLADPWSAAALVAGEP